MLSILNYCVFVEHKKIIQNLSLQCLPGSVHALMGPNGSGKSSLIMSLMGHPVYQVQADFINFNQQNIANVSTQQKSLLGIFVSMQHPIEIQGLSVLNFLQEIARAHNKMSQTHEQFLSKIKQLLDVVCLPESILNRYVNVGFSGGEKKRFELLQMLLLEPKLVMLDEIDSGVDLDGLKMIATVLGQYRSQYPDVIMIIVTHYRNILQYITPDHVHVMMQGEIVHSGEVQVLDTIEQHGYEFYAKRSK